MSRAVEPISESMERAASPGARHGGESCRHPPSVFWTDDVPVTFLALIKPRQVAGTYAQNEIVALAAAIMPKTIDKVYISLISHT